MPALVQQRSSSVIVLFAALVTFIGVVLPLFRTDILSGTAPGGPELTTAA